MGPDNSLLVQVRKALEDHYQIERELGRGVMCVVYLAREKALDRLVALKLLRPRYATPVDREAFLAEARFAAGLNHPSIIPIFRVEQLAGFVFFTMPFMPGGTLQQMIDTNGPVPADAVTDLLRDIAAAVAVAHRRGIIHRDLKTENILVDRETRRTAVTDFGIARLRDELARVRYRELAGTVEFMSPEQAREEPATERSDVYALGVIGFLALTGGLPFTGTREEILEQHRYAPPPPVPVGPGTDSTLPRVIVQCLAKDPDERFQSMDELYQALSQAAVFRREWPVPLRSFLQLVGQTASEMLPVLLFTLMALASLVSSLDAGRRGLALFSAAILLLAFASPLWSVLRVVRESLAAGLAGSDLIRALEVDTTRRGEVALYQKAERLQLAIWAGKAAPFAWGALVMGVILALSGISLPESTVWVPMLAGGVGSVVLTPFYDKPGKIWLALWKSPVGALVFDLAAVRLKARKIGMVSPDERDFVFQEALNEARGDRGQPAADVPGPITHKVLARLARPEPVRNGTTRRGLGLSLAELAGMLLMVRKVGEVLDKVTKR